MLVSWRFTLFIIMFKVCYHAKALEIQQWHEDGVVSLNVFCFSETWVNPTLPSLQVPEAFYSPPLP